MQELERLPFEPQLVEIEQAFYGVGPPSIKQAGLPTEKVNHQRRRDILFVRPLQTRVKPRHKAQIGLVADLVYAKVESRQPNQI